MAGVVLHGKFTAVGMRVRVVDSGVLVVNTCCGNDGVGAGSALSWAWCNPTNRAVVHRFEDVEAVSVEALWQGLKLGVGEVRPDPVVLGGEWRRNKGRRPVGAYAGPGRPLIMSPGEARRRIYVPAFRRLVEHWLGVSEEVRGWVGAAFRHGGNVYLRDHDTGRGLDRNGPLSHAWVLAEFLNSGVWLDGVDGRGCLSGVV